MNIEDEEAALQAIRDNAKDKKERIHLISLFKGLLPDERKDLWHGLTPEDLVDVLRFHLESGGFGHLLILLRDAQEPLYMHATLGLRISDIPHHMRSLPCPSNHPCLTPS